MATPAVLPSPLYRQDPSLFRLLIDRINNTCGLNDTDRLVLIGVLQHLPSTSPSGIISRVATLGPKKLKLLASIFIDGLFDVRSWGTRHNSFTDTLSIPGNGTRVDPDSPTNLPEPPHFVNPAVSALFSHLQILPFPTTTTLVADRDRAIPPGKRSQKLSTDCLERQESLCPITTRSLTHETAHLVPHYLSCTATPNTTFWLLIAIVLGPTLRDQLFEIVYGAESYSTTNGLLLDSSLRRLFDKGAALLLPRFSDETVYDPTTCYAYDVIFRWRDHARDLKLWMTYLPWLPEHQLVESADGLLARVQIDPRPITDRGVFRLWTNDPVEKPLPHPLLLSTHAMLWRMISAAGLGVAGARRKRRIDNVGVRYSYALWPAIRSKYLKRNARSLRSPPLLSHSRPRLNAYSPAPTVSDYSSPPTPVYSLPVPSKRESRLEDPGHLTYMQKAYLDFRLLQHAAETARGAGIGEWEDSDLEE